MEDYHAEDVFSSELFKTGQKSGGCLHCFVGVFDSTRFVRGNSEKNLIPQDLSDMLELKASPIEYFSFL